MKYQRHKEGTTHDWQDCPEPSGGMEPGYVYRVLPEPASPKWPQTTMTQDELWSEIDNVRNAPALEVFANMVIARACEEGQVVTSDQYNERIKSHQQLEIALRDSVRREHDLGNMLHDAVTAVHELDPHRKVRVPTPKPIVYVKSFKQGEIVGRDMQIAINVRAACYAKLPGQVSNEELRTLLYLAK